MKEMVGGCCVCSDERGWPENPLVYCDGQGCTVAVHQACYGIVTVPTGPWFCRKCESQERAVKVKCELCPSRDGALKRTSNQNWAHVVCALYIPEVRFGDVTTMEPIVLELVPNERFSKPCYICEESGKSGKATVGACMQCNKPGCKQHFHVTCAQALGLLCEEAGAFLDNVKYCGYCQHHYSKLKKSTNVKIIPPYKPVSSTDNDEPSPEKELDSSSTTNTSTHSSGSKTPNTSTSSTGSSANISLSSASTATSNSSKRGKSGKITPNQKVTSTQQVNERSKSTISSTSTNIAGKTSGSGLKIVLPRSSIENLPNSTPIVKEEKIKEEKDVKDSPNHLKDTKVESPSSSSTSIKIDDKKVEVDVKDVKEIAKQPKKRKSTSSTTPTSSRAPTPNSSEKLPKNSVVVMNTNVTSVIAGNNVIQSSGKIATTMTTSKSNDARPEFVAGDKIKKDPNARKSQVAKRAKNSACDKYKIDYSIPSKQSTNNQMSKSCDATSTRTGTIVNDASKSPSTQPANLSLSSTTTTPTTTSVFAEPHDRNVIRFSNEPKSLVVSVPISSAMLSSSAITSVVSTVAQSSVVSNSEKIPEITEPIKESSPVLSTSPPVKVEPKKEPTAAIKTDPTPIEAKPFAMFGKKKQLEEPDEIADNAVKKKPRSSSKSRKKERNSRPYSDDESTKKRFMEKFYTEKREGSKKMASPRPKKTLKRPSDESKPSTSGVKRAFQCVSNRSGEFPSTSSSFNPNNIKKEDTDSSSDSEETRSVASSQQIRKNGNNWEDSRDAIPTNRRNGNNWEDSKDARAENDDEEFEDGAEAFHLLGNALNPASEMARKMSKHLREEMRAIHEMTYISDDENGRETTEPIVGGQGAPRDLLEPESGPSAPPDEVEEENLDDLGLVGVDMAEIEDVEEEIDDEEVEEVEEEDRSNFNNSMRALLNWQYEQVAIGQELDLPVINLINSLRRIKEENWRLQKKAKELIRRRNIMRAVNQRLQNPAVKPGTNGINHMRYGVHRTRGEPSTSAPSNSTSADAGVHQMENGRNVITANRSVPAPSSRDSLEGNMASTSHGTHSNALASTSNSHASGLGSSTDQSQRMYGTQVLVPNTNGVVASPQDITHRTNVRAPNQEIILRNNSNVPRMPQNSEPVVHPRMANVDTNIRNVAVHRGASVQQQPTTPRMRQYIAPPAHSNSPVAPAANHTDYSSSRPAPQPHNHSSRGSAIHPSSQISQSRIMSVSPRDNPRDTRQPSPRQTISPHEGLGALVGRDMSRAVINNVPAIVRASTSPRDAGHPVISPRGATIHRSSSSQNERPHSSNHSQSPHGSHHTHATNHNSHASSHGTTHGSGHGNTHASNHAGHGSQNNFHASSSMNPSYSANAEGLLYRNAHASSTTHINSKAITSSSYPNTAHSSHSSSHSTTHGSHSGTHSSSHNSHGSHNSHMHGANSHLSHVHSSSGRESRVDSSRDGQSGGQSLMHSYAPSMAAQSYSSVRGSSSSTTTQHGDGNYHNPRDFSRHSGGYVSGSADARGADVYVNQMQYAQQVTTISRSGTNADNSSTDLSNTRRSSNSGNYHAHARTNHPNSSS